MLSEQNKVVFRVPLDATKPQIKEAVEAPFNVNVTGVNTILVKGGDRVLPRHPRQAPGDADQAHRDVEGRDSPST